MIPHSLIPFINHLWQSTVFAGAVILLTMALRKNRAQVRYWVWLAASAKFLIPFSALLALGSRFEWKSARAIAPTLPVAIQQITDPFLTAMPVFGPTTRTSALPEVLLTIWVCGFLAIATRWSLRWRSVRRTLRSAQPLPFAAPVPVLASPARIEPGIFGLFRPVMLVPAGIAERLTPEQFETILAHEMCHVRRRDNLTSALHMVVEAVFWFHPLVWWIGARLMDERERACDEDVLRQGGQSEVYATGIVNVCRFYLESPLACASGVTGADLRKRIEHIMTGRILDGLTPVRKMLLVAAAIVAVGGPIALGVLKGQEKEKLRFEVASIRPLKESSGMAGIQILPGGELRLDGVSVKRLIALAYGVRPDQIYGGPRWLDADAFSLHAKPEPTPDEDMHANISPGTPGWQRMELRLQTLLAERFQLVLQKDTKEVQGYALVVAKGGPKLKLATEEGPARTMRSRGKIDAARAPLGMLASVLSNFLGRTVEDRSGLTGLYTYTLEYSLESGPGGKAGPDSEPAGSDATGPSVFTALQEQLGLKLESSKVAVVTLHVERVEKPSEN